jgi:phosphate transport system permease protein
MTDASLTPTSTRITPDYGSEAALVRLKKRYASEARFKFLGLGAILLTASFVVILLFDIIRQGLPAFMESRMVAEVELDASKIDPKGSRDTADLRAADYTAIVRDALRARFPEVTDRRERRRLDALVSTGAADDLRAKVLADPSKVGTRQRIPMLLSANTDLFLKGEGARSVSEAGAGPFRLVVTDKMAELTASSPVFAAMHAAAITDVRRQIATQRAELATLAGLAGGNASVEAKRAELNARIASLEALTASNSAIPMEGSIQSILIEVGGGMLRVTELSPSVAKATVLTPVSASGDVAASAWKSQRFLIPESNRRVTDQEIAWITKLKAAGVIDQSFAWRFFTNGDSREPELAGIRGALVGSALMLLVTLALCLPLGVGAAIYLEEFAPKNRFTDILEVNINNLAAVPSIVFGLLGLAVFLNAFDLPRSAPVVGGLVLALLVLPTIIIASRAAIAAVPPSIREAALGVGASHQQAVFHHVLPLAMPGIMTGTIIGMAHALGETAPLLMIGMVAFIVDIPQAFTDAATALPVQIFLWSDLPELAFRTKTAAAIIVLLVFLFVMNGLAIVLRSRFERRW